MRTVKYSNHIEFLEWLRKVNPHMHSPIDEDDAWCGGSMQQAYYMLKHGDHEKAAIFSELIDRMGEESIATFGYPLPTRSYWGTTPNIGAVISGHPKTMYRRRNTNILCAQAPMRLFVYVGMSHTITTKQAIERGAAIMAFALAMQKIRPIELYAVYAPIGPKGCNTTIHIFQIELFATALSIAAFILANPMFPRRLCFAASRIQAGLSATNTTNPGIPPLNSEIIPQLHLEQNDVFIRGARTSDGDAFKNDPIAWVKNIIKARKENATIE